MSGVSGIDSTKGFTLLEVAVALALGATVMVALFGMFEGVLDASEQIRRRSESERAARVLLGVMEDDFRSLCGVRNSDLGVLGKELDEDTGARGEVVLVMTTSATLDFNAPLPNLGVQVVEYVIEEGADGGRFVRREREQAGIKGDFEWTEVVLLKGVEGFKIGFWSRGFNEFNDDWEFYEDADLPLAVKVSFSQRQESGAVRNYELVTPLAGALREAS